MEVLYITDSSANQHNICAINTGNGQNITSYKGGTSEKNTVCVINDDYIVGASPKKAVLNVFELSRKGQHAKKIVTPGVVKSLCVSNDCFHIAAGIEQNVFLWDLSSGELLATMSRHYQDVTCLKFTFDGLYLVSSGLDGIVSVWKIMDHIDISKQDSMKSNEPFRCWSSHALAVTQVCVSTLGYRVYTSSLDQSVKIHDILVGETLLTVVFDTAVTSLAVDSVDFYLYAGGFNGRIYSVDLTASAKKLQRQNNKSINFETENSDDTSVQPIQGHTRTVTCLTRNTDCSLVVSGSLDGEVKVWDVLSGQCLRTVNQKGSITNLLLTLTPFSLSSVNHKPSVPFPKLAHSVYDGSETDKSAKLHGLGKGTSHEPSIQSRVDVINSALFDRTDCRNDRGSKSFDHNAKQEALEREILYLKSENHKLYEFALNNLVQSQN
uniref:Uncharacterized protein n=1 Tax=Ciona savignyi TaxID=51511 RepID=H2ZBH2_CIOSA